MHYVYKALEPEYVRLLAVCKIKSYRLTALNTRAAVILKLKPYYLPVSKETGVPVLWMMAINERESSSDMNSYLGNGQPFRKRTTLVPKNRGPFKSWHAGAKDAIHLDHIDQVKVWSWPMMLFEEELFNGFGPRGHHRHSGYLWGGTTVYDGGKYVKDGKWVAGAWDTQLGTVPLMQTLVRLDPSLDLPGHPEFIDRSPPRVPVGHDDIAVHNILWVQESLNKITGDDDLDVDGSLGRHTARAVRTFQAQHNLPVTGVPDIDTKSAINATLAANNGVL